MPINVLQSEEARMGLLKECVLDVVEKGTMPMDVQPSVRRLNPMILDYIASSVGKMDTLLVGVKKRIKINLRTKIPIAMHSVRRHQLTPFSGWMIKIPQPDKNAINLRYPNLMSHQDSKERKTCFHSAAHF